MTLSKESIEFLVNNETGGIDYYNKYLIHPTWPGVYSGVTIGVGSDIGAEFNLVQFTDTWQKHLSDSEYVRLSRCIGIVGEKAKNLISDLQDITIQWDTAISIFTEHTLPKYYNLTIKTYPKCDELDERCFVALVDLIYNRGASLNGSRRVEMRNIVDCVANKDYTGIMNNLLEMKKLWPNCEGLQIRRQKEAELVKGCIV